jgi:hypothetical protein
MSLQLVQLKLSPIAAMEGTLEVMVATLMEVLDMDLEVTGVDTTLERDLLMLSLIAMEDTLEVMVDTAMEVLDMEVLAMDLEVTGAATILERDQQMLCPILQLKTLVETDSTMDKIVLNMKALDHITLVDLSELKLFLF